MYNTLKDLLKRKLIIVHEVKPVTQGLRSAQNIR